MRSKTTEAIVLTSWPQKERDKLVALLSRDRGLMRAWAYGVRGAKARFGASLEPLSLIRLNYRDRDEDEIVRIESAELIRSMFDVQENLRASVALSYVSELVMTFAQPQENGELYFRMLNAVCEAFTRGADPLRVVAWTELWVTKIAGLFPSLRSCASCGRNLVPPLRFSEPDAGFLCPDCATDRMHTMPNQVAGILSSISSLSVEDFARLDLDSLELFDARMFVVDLRRHFLGHELKSWELLQSTL